MLSAGIKCDPGGRLENQVIEVIKNLLFPQFDLSSQEKHWHRHTSTSSGNNLFNPRSVQLRASQTKS